MNIINNKNMKIINNKDMKIINNTFFTTKHLNKSWNYSIKVACLSVLGVGGYFNLTGGDDDL